MSSRRLALLAVLTLGLVALVAPPALAVDPDGKTPVNTYMRAPDGGTVRRAGSATGAGLVRDEGYPSAAHRCYEVTCSTVGDGGLMGATTLASGVANDASWTAGADAATFAIWADAGTGSNLVAERAYISTVRTASAVRVSQGAACNAFTGGTGRILNEGSTLSWLAQSSPDGGVPLYSCCAESTGAVWNLCEQ